MRHARLTTALIGTALLAALAAPAAADRPIEESLELAADGELQVEILSGSLVVHGWDRAEVRVTGSVGDDVDDLDIGGDGRRAWVEVDGDHAHSRHDLDADLEIWLPSTARLLVDTLSADIGVSDLAGELELGAVSGDITVSGSPSSIEAETVSGDVRLDGADSRSGTAVAVETVSGNVQLHGVGRTVEASAVSGTIEVSAVAQVHDIGLETVSGGVELEAALAPGARVDISSHSGSIVLRLPGDTSASFDVSTFNGSVDNDFGPPAQRVDRFGPGKSLEFSTGGGDARISIETFSGDVGLKRQ